MRQSVIVLFLLFFLQMDLLGQTSNEILFEHYKAHNQAFWESIKTISIEGKWLSPKGFVPMKLWAKKPANIVFFGKWKKKRYALAFDGNEAWTIAPWTGYFGAQLMTAEEEISIKHVMDFGSPIRDITKLEYKGEVVDNGVPCYWYMEKTAQYEIEYFINKKTYLMFKMNKRERYDTNILLMTKTYDVYRDFGGVVFPSFVRIKTESGESDLSFDKIFLGEAIDSKIFLKSTHQ